MAWEGEVKEQIHQREKDAASKMAVHTYTNFTKPSSVCMVCVMDDSKLPGSMVDGPWHVKP